MVGYLRYHCCLHTIIALKYPWDYVPKAWWLSCPVKGMTIPGIHHEGCLKSVKTAWDLLY